MPSPIAHSSKEPAAERPTGRADALLDSTTRGDIVLDAFLGNGATLIAAERAGRRCDALEMDPLYDTAIRRWQAYTGEPAYNAATGRSFDETASTLGAAE